ncbi:response regulator [Rudanella paleaurantiibacter]|uniref:histidine kinase n=2 Tax=Rudanella paleaurantiibacter TaxID=2614655 RepID=A0A7J5TZK6_9BACT|nr:response regulator [Rudanella paleaurantiibacter]
MGQNFRICWETALPVVGDAFTHGQQGEGTYIKDQRMFLDRYGYLEETFMTFSFAPIRDESGQVGGIFHPITETTDKMLSARRTQVLRDVAALTGQAKTKEAIYENLALGETDFALDLPFLLVYELDEEGTYARLANAVGLSQQYPVPAHLLELNVAQTDWLSELSNTLVINDLLGKMAPLEAGPYPELPHTAVRLPIRLSTRAEPVGFLVAGVSPRRALDPDYLTFYAMLANTISTAFSNVYAYQEEQKRAEALAAIDRAKTAFFSNVSHEFRTPLTLMLGPLEELLQRADVQVSDVKEPIETTHRNALRLLKLVNNLLDFSRTEAGRTRATYRPVDLVGLTVDLASSFRSLIERAGLQYTVDCQPLPSVVYADAEMWEKIVLNLLSNAFKYTLEGEIRVALTAEGNEVVLRVSDTGIGIPAHELPHMFERFHRVEQAGGRTYEGSGIGLSLVHELVQMHGGTIAVTSTEGEGSTFTVRLPLGKAHLPGGQVVEEVHTNRLSPLTESFLKEAGTMLGEMPVAIESGEQDANAPKIPILVVDDNPDMRGYLTRLLQPSFEVRTAVNGADALEQLKTFEPQLILSDIMMPVMDGKALLQNLRQNPATAQIPLIFLSARAGQEARIDGLEAGADDYLVKPFSAQELLTKVRAQIALNLSRRQSETQLRNLVEHAPVAMLLVKGDNLVVELINQAMLDLVQREGEVLGKPLQEALPELVGQPFIDRCQQVFQTGVPDQGWAVPVPINRNGQLETAYFNMLLTPYYEGNTRTGVLEICTDVTELVLASQALAGSEARYRQLSAELDLQVQQRTAELQASVYDLQRSNENLQQFAYVASHDLQEPLRKIQSFGDLLQKQYADQLGEGGEHLTRMQAAANRMSTLIRDLLSFSRISTRQEAVAPVSLAHILQDVLADLEVTIQETGAQMHIEPLPTVPGDRSQLRQLFQNLIANALKFQAPGIAPAIWVREERIEAADLPPTVKPARRARAFHRIDVRDNGIGFDEKYVDRIFQVFQRLHGRNQFSGTGIGLAICQKVASNHGGAIVASSRPGEGSTFSLYLPV